MSLQVVSKKAARVAAAQGPSLARAMSTEHYSAHQKSLGRPVSPHVTIYTMPATAKSSITNRFAAMGMSTAFAAGSAVAFVGGDIPALIYAAQDLIPGFATASKLLVAFPISYHLLSAARAVTFARMPQLINNADGPKSTYALYGASAVITLAAGAYTIKAPEDEIAATEA